MDLTEACSHSVEGGSETIAGSVRIDSLFEPREEDHPGGASITFEPGARTAWHTHPRSQVLIITDGCGLVPTEDGTVEQVRPGDVVRFEAEEKH